MSWLVQAVVDYFANDNVHSTKKPAYLTCKDHYIIFLDENYRIVDKIATSIMFIESNEKCLLSERLFVIMTSAYRVVVFNIHNRSIRAHAYSVGNYLKRMNSNTLLLKDNNLLHALNVETMQVHTETITNHALFGNLTDYILYIYLLDSFRTIDIRTGEIKEVMFHGFDHLFFVDSTNTRVKYGTAIKVLDEDTVSIYDDHNVFVFHVNTGRHQPLLLAEPYVRTLNQSESYLTINIFHSILVYEKESYNKVSIIPIQSSYVHCVFEKYIYLDFEDSVVRVNMFDHKRQVIHHYGKDRNRDIRVVQNDIIYTKGNRMRIYSMETDKHWSQIDKYDVIFPLYERVKRRRRMFQIRRDAFLDVIIK